MNKRLICILFVAVAIFLIARNKGGNWIAVLPVLACVGMHFFMHSSRGADDGKRDSHHSGGSCCGGEKKPGN